MLGRNVWFRDIETGEFYGHVRVFIKRIKHIIKSNDNLSLSDDGGSNGLIYVYFMKKYGNKSIPKIFSIFLDKIISAFPTLCLQLYVVAKINK